MDYVYFFTIVTAFRSTTIPILGKIDPCDAGVCVGDWGCRDLDVLQSREVWNFWAWIRLTILYHHIFMAYKITFWLTYQVPYIQPFLAFLYYFLSTNQQLSKYSRQKYFWVIKQNVFSENIPHKRSVIQIHILRYVSTLIDRYYTI